MEQKWLLCDMHMHSQYSAITKKGDRSKVKEMSAEEYVETLKKHNVEVFSITDHNYFSSEYYDEIEEYIVQKKYCMKVVNGVELDVYIKESKKDYIHICFYFADDVDRKELHTVINSLYFDMSGNSLYPNFSTVLNALYDLKSKFIIVPHGDKDKRGIFEAVLKNKISDKEDFYKYAMYKVYNAYDVKPNFQEKSFDHWAANFFKHTQRFNEYVAGMSEDEQESLEKKLVKKIKDHDFELDEKENDIYQYIKNYGSYYAYFSFTDWHNASEYNPRINNFIFGSLSYAFESFEMATLDPESRIQKSKDKNIEISSSILKKIEFKINGEKQIVNLSPGLNVVVGKRGSGKSLFLSVIKSLVKKDDKMGALKLYSDLNISDIVAENRGGIKFSLGSLGSTVFLHQDDISKIFENPKEAERDISRYFKQISKLDTRKLEEISSIAKKIIPYEKNYKNITNNLLSLEKNNSYLFDNYEFMFNSDILNGFDDSIFSLLEVKKKLKDKHLNVNRLIEEIDRIEKLKKYYAQILYGYKDIIDNTNILINKEKQKRTTNQKIDSMNHRVIMQTIEELKNNLEIRLNLKKLIYCIENLKIDNPPVEISIRGKYLFATYYEIPKDIGENVLDCICKCISYANNTDGIIEYVNGNERRNLNKSATSLSTYLDKFIESDFFDNKNSFYEIKNFDINYEEKIKTLKDLNQYAKNKDLIDLTKASLGMKSVAYLDMLFNLEQTILVLDQPEDNIDNDYISHYLVPNIKTNKRVKQLIFVTHNPSVAVYGDAFNYIYVENNDKIKYSNYFIERQEDKEKLINILEGGKRSFSNRNKKFGNILGEEEYENNKRKQ